MLTGYQREYLLITICQLRYVIMRTEAIPCAFHYKSEMALCFLSIYVFGLNLNWVTYAKMKGSEWTGWKVDIVKKVWLSLLDKFSGLVSELIIVLYHFLMILRWKEANPLLPGVPFSYPLKTSENRRFSQEY